VSKRAEVRVSIRAVVGAAILSCIAAFADEKPNFSGVWRHESTLNKIEHQDPNIRIAYESKSAAGPLASSVGGTQSYTVDGVERTTQTRDGGSWTTVNWQGVSLVILRAVKNGYRVRVTRETWTISPDGDALTKHRRTISMDGVTESTQVYRKQ
jgi:hypothetical protein